MQEYFADYVPINPALFSLNYSTPPMNLWSKSANEWDPEALDRHTSGLVALLLSLKKKPLVRYERMSALARKLGEEVHVRVDEAWEELLWISTDCEPLILISIRCSLERPRCLTFAGQTHLQSFSSLIAVMIQ